MRVIGVHGLFGDGATSVDKLLWELDIVHGVMTADFNWTPRGPVSAVHSLKKNARRLAALNQQDCVIAHSFGARVVLEAMRQGARFPLVFLFNPAIPDDTWFPREKYDHIHVIAHPQDRFLTLGDRLLGFLGYGELGRVGYRGKSQRVTTHMGPMPALFEEHGQAFGPKALVAWAAFIKKEISLWTTN